MPETSTLMALADALEAASAVLRERALEAVQPVAATALEANAVDRARSQHPALGPRQAEIISVLELYAPGGTNMGVISRAIEYSQSNVHLTLMGLINLGMVVRDEDVRPHVYRLTDRVASGSN
jgi:DNA-binding transcriptional ArsR family regulator